MTNRARHKEPYELQTVRYVNGVHGIRIRSHMHILFTYTIHPVLGCPTRDATANRWWPMYDSDPIQCMTRVYPYYRKHSAVAWPGRPPNIFFLFGHNFCSWLHALLGIDETGRLLQHRYRIGSVSHRCVDARRCRRVWISHSRLSFIISYNETRFQ